MEGVAQSWLPDHIRRRQWWDGAGYTHWLVNGRGCNVPAYVSGNLKGIVRHPKGDVDIGGCGGAGVRRGWSGNEGNPEWKRPPDEQSAGADRQGRSEAVQPARANPATIFLWGG